MSERSLRVGVVGAGGVATRHARVLAGLPAVQVVGIADPVTERAEQLASAHDAVAVADCATLLKRTKPDAVYVCVPPGFHGEPEEAVLDAGLPLFVEKPLAADLETAESLADRVARAGVVTATGYHWRHLDTVSRARRLFADRPVRLAMATWLDTLPPPAWWRRRDGSGGQIVEQATHVLDLLRVLVGEVVEVRADAERGGIAGAVDDDRTVDDSTVALLRFETGAIATVVATCGLDRKHRASVELLAPGLRVELSETLLVAAGDGIDERVEPSIDPRLAVDRAFVTAVRTGDLHPSLVPYAEALQTHRVAVAVTEAARTGRAVRLGARPSTAGGERP